MQKKGFFGLAPMDGITDLPYRYITKKVIEKYNPHNIDNFWTWTEFMSAEGFVRNPNGVIKPLIHLQNDKTPLIAQIYGGNGESLLQTAETIAKKYPDFLGVELNIGCPSPKVMFGGAGAGMMKDRKNTLKIIKQISARMNDLGMNFSIKTRIGLDEQDKNEQMNFILEASQYCFLVAVHGRTFRQQHSGDVDWESLENLQKQISKNTESLQKKYGTIGESLFVANGGISTYSQIQDKLNDYDGVMIGQAAIGNPWIFVEHSPTIEDKYRLAKEHFSFLMAYEYYLNKYMPEFVKTSDGINTRDICVKLEDLLEIQKNISDSSGRQVDLIDKSDFYYSPIEFRKYLFNYVKGFVGNKEFKVRVSEIKDYNGVVNEIEKFFENIVE